MAKKYFTVGTFFGIELRINYSWFIIFALITWVVTTQYLPSYKQHFSPVGLISGGLVVTILFFISAIAHEYAHSIVANHRGLKIRRITLFMLGGASELQKEPESPKTEFLVAIAGPLTSLVLAGAFAGLGYGAGRLHATNVHALLQPLAMLNFAVAIFNLVPAFPLDGGRVLRSSIWLVTKDKFKATRSASYVSMALASLMVIVGILAIYAGGIIGGLWLGLLGYFLFQTSRYSYWQASIQNSMHDIKVSDVYHDEFMTVPSSTPMHQFLTDYVMRQRQYDFLIVDRNGDPVGIINLSQISRGSRVAAGEVVDDYMYPLTKKLILKPNDPVSKAVLIMQAENVNILPVMQRSDLLGVVMRQYLEDYILAHRLQRSAIKR